MSKKRPKMSKMSLHNKDANKNATFVKQPKNQTNTDGEDREDGEDLFSNTTAIRHTQHVRLKGPEPRWSDTIMTMKEKQKRDSKQTRSAHIPKLLKHKGVSTKKHLQKSLKKTCQKDIKHISKTFQKHFKNMSKTFQKMSTMWKCQKCLKKSQKCLKNIFLRKKITKFWRNKKSQKKSKIVKHVKKVKKCQTCKKDKFKKKKSKKKKKKNKFKVQNFNKPKITWPTTL